uniref:Uncharacterized protein n=1 Tax=Oryza punctata TaxID=4537 RepID=A0A0E0LXT1_ORYPU
MNTLHKRAGFMASARRRGDSTTVQSYARAAKKAQRHIRRITGGSSSSSKPAASEMEGCSLVRLLAEAREVAVAALETAAAKLLPKQIATMLSSSRLSQLVSKKKRAPSCEEEQLQVLELDIAGLENGVEVLFRRLIQSRVSLLNTLTLTL